MKAKIRIFAIIGGVAITLLTGLIPNTPMLVGAVHYGYPFSWLIRLVIAPEYFPWRINVLNLVADIVVWTIVVGILLFVSTRKILGKKP